MRLFLRFALRNLQRHSRRTILTVLAMTFGLSINFVLDCLLRGRNEEVVKYVTSSFTGQYQLYSKAFFSERAIVNDLKLDPTSFSEDLKKQIHYSPRVHLPSLISSGEHSLPVLAYGIEPELEKNVSTVRQSVVQGEFISSDATCSPGEIIIGQKLATSLKIGIGEKIVVLTQAADGNLGNELFRVKGLFDTGSTTFDKSFVFMNSACAKQLGAVSNAHEIAISVIKAENQSSVLAQLQKLVNDEQLVTTWEESLPTVSRMIKVNNAIMGLVSFILLVVVILGFVNTLLMSVMERTREIGMLMAVGVSPGQVRMMVVMESVLIGLLSSVASIIFGLLIAFYYRQFGFDLTPFVGQSFEANQFSLSLTIYPVISIWPFLKVLGLSLLIVTISALIPAYRASKLTPLDAIRSN